MAMEDLELRCAYLEQFCGIHLKYESNNVISRMESIVNDIQSFLDSNHEMNDLFKNVCILISLALI